MIAQETIDEAVRRLFSTIEFTQDPEGLYDPLRYMVAIGGKRLRPKLCLTVYSLFNDAFGPEILGPAAGLEVFHTFTLIHDDIMDRSPLRRGQETVWKKWSPDTAILSGDVMCIDAYKRIAQAPVNTLPAVLELFSTTAAQVCDGQQYDMDFEKVPSVSMRNYLKMIGLKTAVLIACSAKMGALIASAPAEICEGAPDGLDAQLVHHVLVVLFGGERYRRLRKGRCAEQAAGEQKDGLFHIRGLFVSSAKLVFYTQKRNGFLKKPGPRGHAADPGTVIHVAEDARETIARFHEKALQAASKVTGIGGYEVLKQFADDLVDRVK